MTTRRTFLATLAAALVCPLRAISAPLSRVVPARWRASIDPGVAITDYRGAVFEISEEDLIVDRFDGLIGALPTQMGLEAGRRLLPAAIPQEDP